MLGVVCANREVAGAEQPGFSRDCSGFVQDSMLGDLWPEKTGAEQRHASLTAMVPRLSMHGTALATYATYGEGRQAAADLETLFGVSQYGHRKIVETTFYQEARAVVLYPNVLATVAHALTPDIVEVQVEEHNSVHTVPLNVTSMAVVAHVVPSDYDMPAQVKHINEPYDLALVQTGENTILQPLPYSAVLSYGTGDPRQPIGGMQAGDCVAAIVTLPNGDSRDRDRLVVGKVLAKVPVAINSMSQTKLNVNMFTTDLEVKPGDSGSPVLALRAGKPVLVGLVSATMYPTAAFTYVSRIDPLLALADALRLADTRLQKQALAQSKDRMEPEAK